MKRALLILCFGILLVTGHLVFRETVKGTARELAKKADLERKFRKPATKVSYVTIPDQALAIREGIIENATAKARAEFERKLTERKITEAEPATDSSVVRSTEDLNASIAQMEEQRKEREADFNARMAAYDDEFKIIDREMQERFAHQERRAARRANRVASQTEPYGTVSPSYAPEEAGDAIRYQRTTDHEVIMGRPVPVITHPGADWEVTTGTVDLPGSLTPGTWTADRAAVTVRIIDPSGTEITVRGN